jgi:hypothetical protein
MIRRFLGDGPAKYRVVALFIAKPEIDTFSGSPSIEFIYRAGDFKNPVNFLSFFQEVQPT